MEVYKGSTYVYWHGSYDLHLEKVCMDRGDVDVTWSQLRHSCPQGQDGVPCLLQGDCMVFVLGADADNCDKPHDDL